MKPLILKPYQDIKCMLYIVLGVLLPCYGIIAYVFVVNTIAHPENGNSSLVILAAFGVLILLCAFGMYYMLWAKVTITEKEVRWKSPFHKAVVYQMEDIRVCVKDITFGRFGQEFMMFSRENMKLPVYRYDEYTGFLSCNKVWRPYIKRSFFTPHRANQFFLSIRMNDETANTVLPYLPEHLQTMYRESVERYNIGTRDIFLMERTR